MVVLVEDDAPVERARLVSLAERGAPAGVFVLWVASSRQALPASCRTFVDVSPIEVSGSVGFVHSGESVAPVRLDGVDADTAMEIARRLAPLLDSGSPVDDASDLPRSVSMLALSGRELASSAEAVIERWVESSSVVTGPYATPAYLRRAGSLRAVVGQSAGEPHILDLRTHGPHALVGGTTGSGKSELLQSWILGMAAAHSPQRVTFLLVDYKGGSAFRDCVQLPHTIGLVTDLSPHLVRRALTSLAAELRYREHTLAAKGAKDLLELEKRGDADAPPSLVIVVDEFAALVHEVPEFVDGVVNVAQRGRSLGLHLVLATQRPAGVIKDNLRANTNLRVALRMADEDDSSDVLGTPQAAAFDPALPGRAVSKTGPGRLVPFQAAYAGGWTTDAPPRPEILVEELVFGTGPVWEAPEIVPTAASADPGATDIQRIVHTINAARALAEIPEARKPWLAELAGVYDLARLPTSRRDDELVFGVADDPDHQTQPVVSFLPDRDGNLAVYGTGGSGKSTLLRSIAVAAGFTVRGGPCHVYGLDFGARGLHMLEELPHVGSIISGGDHERVVRLIGWLRGLVADRAARYARVRAGTITEYRRLAKEPNEARILVLLDGLAAFRQAYEVGEHGRWFEALVGVANDGRPVGVHLLLSADRPAAVPSSMGSAIQRR
ncbi:MAG TPA: FtsK/SpoIIIE domain-containing protein, partial [Galbitalea sp.]